MTGLKLRVRQQRNTSDFETSTRPQVHSYSAGPASPAADSPRTDVHPTRPWDTEAASRDSVSAHRDSQLHGLGSSTDWRRTVVSKTSVDSSSVITPGVSSVQTSNDWTPAPGLSRSGQGPYSGYLGSTSFNAVFDENRNRIGIVVDSDNIHATRVECLSTHEHNCKIREGAAVLAQLAEFKHLEALISRWLEYARALALIGPFTTPCVEAIDREVVSRGLEPQDLLVVSEKLLHNSTRPLEKVSPDCKMSEYHTLFTGANIRWETLGLLFTAAGLSAILLGPTDPLLSFVGRTPADKQAFIHRMVQLGSSCLGFCTDVGHLNDLGLWILHEHCLLVSQILGDAHYLTWRRFGDLSTAVFAMGLHQEIKISPDIPFWLTEFRRRSVGIIYGIDKMMSVFLGRPPHISHRYCSITYPLDLEFEDLDGPDLATKLASIDEVTGWNSHGAMQRSSHTRCFVIINRIREDILELSLGCSVDDVTAISADITRRNEQAWNEFPKSLKYYPEIWTGKRSADECVTTVIVYLDIIYNEFLLQRTLVRRVRAPAEPLTSISRLLLSTVLAVVNNRSHCGSVGCDAGWIVVLYGLPASGVLALELLQQTQNRAQMTKDFPRSEVIQNLSVFVSCLGWIHIEGDGNYHLCIQARNMIQRILDRVLSPEATYSAQQTLPTPSSNDYADETMYDFSWMDNAQFDADFWSNLDFHPLLAIPES